MSFNTSSIKDRERYKEVDNRWKRGYRARTGSFKYKKRQWSGWEIEKVLKHEKSDRELSEELQRSVVAIQVKRANFKNSIDNNNIV